MILYQKKSEKKLVELELTSLPDIIDNVVKSVQGLDLQRAELDKSGFSSSQNDRKTSFNLSLDIGKKLSSHEECSNLQNIVKQSVDGIIDILKNNPSSNKNSDNQSKRKKLEFQPNLKKKFETIEEKDEEHLGKLRNSNIKTQIVDEAIVSPVKKPTRKNNLLYTGKNKNLNTNSSKVETIHQSQSQEKNNENSYQNNFSEALNSNKGALNVINPVTPKKDIPNLKERRNKLLKEGNDRTRKYENFNQNENEKNTNEMNQAIKGAPKNIDNLSLKKGMTPSKLSFINDKRAGTFTPNLSNNLEKKNKIIENKKMKVDKSHINEKDEKTRYLTTSPLQSSKVKEKSNQSAISPFKIAKSKVQNPSLANNSKKLVIVT